MAWQAKLIDPITYAAGQVVAQVAYYDDTTPDVVLHQQAFTFPPAWSNADMRVAIQSRGQEVRAAQARAAALATNFPVASTTIPIP